MDCKKCTNGKIILMLGPIFQSNSNFEVRELECPHCNKKSVFSNNMTNNLCQCGIYYNEKIKPHNYHYVDDFYKT